LSWRGSGIFSENENGYGDGMTPRERAKIIVQQLHETALRSRTALIETAIRDAENDILPAFQKGLRASPIR
jgi:hypothetical protein